MKKTGKELLAKVVILLCGLSIAHFGVTLFLLADLGSDPFNVLVQGIFQTLDQAFGWSVLTHGRTHMAICFLIILVLLVVDRTYIKIGTILCMIFGGPIIDVFTAVLQGVFNNSSPFVLRLIGLAAGCVIMAYGMTIVMKSDCGTGPNDLAAIVISDKLRKKFSLVRILVDLSFVVIGFVQGGAVGIGTIICVCVVGPVAGIFLPFNEKLIRRIMDRVMA